MTRTAAGRRGSTLLEFTLVGIPLVFVLVSTFEMARGMWLYNTLAFAVKEGVRFASVKGALCQEMDELFPDPPQCAATVATIARRIKDYGVGLNPDELTITLTAGAGTRWSPPQTCRLSDCLALNTPWPPDAYDWPQLHAVRITASYPFRSAIAMFWPGAAPSRVSPTFTFPASAMQEIQF